MDASTLIILFGFLVLSGVIGYFVVWGVTPALHTPLMAVTNAISGIVIVAAILVAGPDTFDPVQLDSFCGIMQTCNATAVIWLQSMAKILGFLAVVLCAINIFGGFAITRRMLAMYRAKTPAGPKGE